MKLRELSRVDELLIILVLLHNIPIVGYHTPAIFFGIVVILLYAFTIRDILIIWKVKLSPFLWIMSLPILSLLANTFYDSSNFITEFYGLLQNISYPIIGFILIKYDMPKITKHIFWVIFLSNILTAFTTFVGCNMVPGASRMIASTDRLRESGMESLIKNLNIGGFSYNYGWALMVPLLIMMYQEKAINKVIVLGAILIFAAAVLSAEYTLAIMFFTISLLLFFIPAYYGKKKFQGTIVFASIIIIMNLLILSQVLDYLAENVFDGSVAGRLKDLSSVIASNDYEVSDNSDLSERRRVYNMSLEVFMTHPLGAWDIKEVGGHSYILDILARFGYIGVFLLWVTYKKIFGLFIKPFEKSKKYGIALFAFLFTILTEIVNPQPNLMYISFVLPVFWRFSQFNIKR